eukprot:1184160-Prorocentrum_minimum.AAC.2
MLPDVQFHEFLELFLKLKSDPTKGTLVNLMHQDQVHWLAKQFRKADYDKSGFIRDQPTGTCECVNFPGISQPDLRVFEYSRDQPTGTCECVNILGISQPELCTFASERGQKGEFTGRLYLPASLNSAH